MDRGEAAWTSLYAGLQGADLPGASSPGQPPLRASDLGMRLASAAQGLGAVRSQFGEPLALILAFVGVVLLIAAVNVANLLLARGAARAPELATRAALGAGRGRPARQLATEGSLLVALGGLLGVWLAWLGTPALASLVSLRLDTAPDYRVLAVALLSTALAALPAAIVPALRLTGATLQASMAEARRATPGRHEHRWARALVAAQLSLSLLLVSAAGLLLRTMVRIAGIDPGFRPEHVVLLEVRDEAAGSSWGVADTAEQKARRAAFYRSLDERLNALPGVRTASVSWLGLFGGSDLWLSLIDPDQPEDRPLARVDYVSARYFETVGMQMLRGRGFDDGDREGTERVAVVNQALAQRRFGGGEAVGRRLALDYRGEEDRPFTVVGVVRDSKYNDLREDAAKPMMWVPLLQAPFRITSVALRVAPGTEASVARRAEAALASTDAQL